MSMVDPAMQQAMAGMVGGGASGGVPAGPAGGVSDEDLLLLVLELIASGQLSGPGVQVLAEVTGGGGGMPPAAGGVPAGPMGGAPGGAPMV